VTNNIPILLSQRLYCIILFIIVHFKSGNTTTISPLQNDRHRTKDMYWDFLTVYLILFSEINI